MKIIGRMWEKDEEGKCNYLKMSVIPILFLGLSPSAMQLLDPCSSVSPSVKLE